MARKKKVTKTMQKRVRKRQLVAVALLLIALAFSASFILILNQEQFVISSIEVSDTQFVVHSDIQTFVQDQIEGKNSLYIPVASTFFYPKDTIVDSILGMYPSVKQVDVSLDNMNTMRIDITERTDQYRYCAQGQCYKLSPQAIAFAQTEELNQGLIFTSHIHDNQSVSLPYAVMSSNELGRILEITTRLNTLGVPIMRVHINNDLETLLVTQSGTVLVTRHDASSDSIVELLREVLTYKEFKYDFPTGTFGSKTAYINLRFGSKLFYCYAGEECENNYRLDYDY